MNKTLLELGRLTIAHGTKQSAVSRVLGDAKDMSKVRKAPVPGYRWSKPDEPTAVEGSDKLSFFGMKTESERAIERQIAEREQAYIQQVNNARKQYDDQVKQWQASVNKQRTDAVTAAKREYRDARFDNVVDKVHGVGRVATGFIRTPAAWTTGLVAGGLTGARAAVADARQTTEELLIGDPNREMAARMGVDQAKAEAAKPMPAAAPAPEIQVPNSFKPVPTTPEAANAMYRPTPYKSIITGKMKGMPTVQKPNLGPAPQAALPAPPKPPALPAIPNSLRTTVSNPAEALKLKNSTGPMPMKPVKLDADPKASGVVKQANPALKAIAGMVANAYRTTPLVRAGAALASGGALAASTPLFLPAGSDPATVRSMALKNFIFGTLMGSPVPAKWRTASPYIRGAEGTLATLSNAGFGMAERGVKATEALTQSQIADTLAAAKSREAATAASQAQASASKQIRNAAVIISAGILGATGYRVWKDQQQAQKRQGNIRVTLPTKRLGDTESTVDMPLDVLSTEAYKGIMRDTRRRVRSENTERIQRKGTATTPMQAGADMYDSFAEPA